MYSDQGGIRRGEGNVFISLFFYFIRNPLISNHLHTPFGRKQGIFGVFVREDNGREMDGKGRLST